MKRFRPLFNGGLVMLALTFVLVLGATDTRAEATFTPEITVAVTDPTPEASSNFVGTLDITIEDVNFAAVVAFIPPDWGIVPGDQLPIGTDVGWLDAASTLGLFGNPCNQPLPVHFDFKNASIDREDTVTFYDEDKTDSDNTADYAKDVDNNGLYDAIDKYPDYLNRLFEDLQPIRRSAGITLVAGIPVLLQFLVFPPGTEIDEDLPSDAERGYPSVTVLQNAGDPEIVPAPSVITDFCTPLSTQNTTRGVTCDPAVPDEGACTAGVIDPGIPLFVNPKAGDHDFSTVAFGQRDADGDGFENSLDTCALLANVGTPKVSLDGDLDSDGLDAACDPNDDPLASGTDSDEDADGYLNRQDNCPLDANGVADTSNQEDEDRDQIGDVCDPDAAVENGDLSLSDLGQTVTIGSGGSGGAPACAAEGGSAGVQCWYEGYVQGGGTTTSTEPTPEGDTPAPSTDDGDEDGGSSSTLPIIIGVAALAAAIIGGGVFMMRRRSDSGNGGSTGGGTGSPPSDTGGGGTTA